jgi:hypothetical protein
VKRRAALLLGPPARPDLLAPRDRLDLVHPVLPVLGRLELALDHLLEVEAPHLDQKVGGLEEGKVEAVEKVESSRTLPVQ